jgi:hypothetical protein
MNDLVDVAGLGRQQQHAKNRAEALHRHGHRNDQFASFSDPDDRTAPSGQCIHHLGIDRSVSARRLAVKRQIGALEEPIEP